jgi:DNA polymerase-3 subunit gamma/tau
MSYQVIARKWRPQAFEEVTGQDHITRTLRNAIEHERLHHAYVFSGARGVGKTTTARLFAKALNCHKTAKPNPQPCKAGDADVCPSCLEISEGRSIDVLELDAASNTGVQNVRDVIIENLNIGPARDRNKVFIIDEVHMLSTPAFNALLKSVEEPPPNVYFILATTELHKIPDTIRSRSQEFIFRTIPQGQIFERLRLIADAEKVNIEAAALQVIARSGEGSMRDAQSNFDQVISFSGEKISVDDVSTALGLASGEVIGRIVNSLATGESKNALEVVADIVDRGQDLRNFARDVLGVLRDLLIFKVSGGDASLVESSVLTADDLKSQAERFTEADLVRFFHSLAETEARLKDAVQSRYVLEVGLVKLIEMRRVRPVEELLTRLASLEASLGSAGPPEGGTQNLAASAGSEKKTLNPEPTDADRNVRVPGTADIPVRSAPVPGPTEPGPSFSEALPEGPSVPDDPFGDGFGSADLVVEEPEFTDAPVKFSTDLDFINSLPVKLPPISSEDLEHIEDKKMDALYERKLEWSGDDLMPIAKAEDLAKALIGNQAGAIAAKPNGNGSAAAAAPSRAPLNLQIPNFEEEDAKIELPVLSDNPTEEELFAYANAHPMVRKAMRIFRAKVIAVNKKQP